MIQTGNLLNGHTQSCGCLSREAKPFSNLQHGHSSGDNRTPEYRAWQAMKQRCLVAQRDNYKHYGGRGIQVCAGWIASFQSFFDSVGPRPSGHHTLGRIDNDGNYEPGNVRWETKKEQGRNRRSNNLLTYNGETKTAQEWMDIYKIPKSTFYRRLRRGLPPDARLVVTLI